MCEDCGPTSSHSRRSVLVGGLAAAAAVWVAPRSSSLALARAPGPTSLAAGAGVVVYPGLSIRPRADWASGRPPAGPLRVEPDVRFLLVHHTASSNTYVDTQDQIRAIYEFHTGADKRWPDVAYNFIVDRFGGVWECRSGSLQGAVEGDATGGNQGFSQLAAFLGTHSSSLPTAAAQESMVRLLAWLADREGIVTTRGSTTSFVSRGSNRHPAGSTVIARTIAGHRDMSQTSCPGDVAYQRVLAEWPDRITAYRASIGGGSLSVTPVSGGYRIRGSVGGAGGSGASLSVFIDRIPVQGLKATVQGAFDLTVFWPPGAAEVCVYRSDVTEGRRLIGCRKVSR